MNRKIAVVMGSDSDYEKMKNIIPILRENHVDYEFRVISAHRTPHIAAEFAENAKSDGYELIIAGAGMSAHLAGVLAAFTGVPIIGLPIKSNSSGMDGMDALHSIIQMPPGIPVAAVGIDHAEGAARLAVKMLDSCSIKANNSDQPIVRIIHDSSAVSPNGLDKTEKTLTLYAIKYAVTDIAGTDITEDPLSCDNTFAILNLTDVNIEKAIQKNEWGKKLPIIQVPLKALTGNFNDTSNKIYHQTGDSDAVGFVGVNAYQNAAHMIARIVGIGNKTVYDEVVNEHSKLAADVIEKDAKMRTDISQQKY